MWWRTHTNAGNFAPQVAFQNCMLFTKCITKVDGITINEDENLDLIMPKYNLFEYSPNYFDTTDSLWFYSKDYANNFDNDIVNTNAFKSLKGKTKLIRNTAAANVILEGAITAVCY